MEAMYIVFAAAALVCLGLLLPVLSLIATALSVLVGLLRSIAKLIGGGR